MGYRAWWGDARGRSARRHGRRYGRSIPVGRLGPAARTVRRSTLGSGLSKGHNALMETRARSARRLHQGSHDKAGGRRSEEHTSELQSLMRISYAVFCLKKKKQNAKIRVTTNTKFNKKQARQSHNKHHNHDTQQTTTDPQ